MSAPRNDKLHRTGDEQKEMLKMVAPSLFFHGIGSPRSPRRMRSWLAIVGLLSLTVFLILSAGLASAQEGQPLPVTDDQVNAVARELFCPVCENVPLDVCPTQACAEWRELIRLKLSEGWDEEQIKVYFAQQYGDRVLSAPPARGLNWLVYILPPLAILAGVFILFRAFKAWKENAPQVETETATPAEGLTNVDPYVTRLEEELKKW